MPIDPSLITDTLSHWQVPQVQVADPLAAYSKLQALKSGIVQQQIQQQQLQTGALDLQQKQQEVAGQKALSDALRANLSVGPNGQPLINHAGVVQALSAGGFGPQALKYQEGVATQQKNQADAQKIQLENTRATLDQAAGYFVNAQNQSDWDAATAHLAGLGGDAAKLGIPPVYSDAAKAAVQNMALTTKDRLDNLAKKQEADAKTSEAKTAADKFQREKDQDFINSLGSAQNPADYAALLARGTQAGVSPAVISAAPATFDPKAVAQYSQQTLTAKDRAEIAQRAQAQQQTAAYQAAELGLRRASVGAEYANLALRKQELAQKSNSDFANLNPADQAIAEKVASGEMSVQQLSRMPNKQGITGAAIELNPNWSAATFDTRQAFTDPNKKMSQNLGTIARIVGHIGQFEQNSKNLGFAPAYAAGVTLTGDQARLREDAHAISSEFEKLVSGGVATQAQAQAWQAALSSPLAGTRQQAIDEISKLIGSQFEGMNQTYKAGLGVDMPIERYVSQAGQQWMRNKGINMPVPLGGTAAAAAPPASLLRRNFNTVFKNGQVWTLDQNGNPQQVK